MTAPAQLSHRLLTAVLIPCALLVLLLVNSWPGFLSPIEWSHAQAALALVDRGSFEVSPEVALLGRHDDLSTWNGRLYSNKAPGLSWLAAPAVAALRGLVERPSFAAVLWASRTLACLLPLLLFVPWFERERVRRGDSPRMALLASLALLLGTPALVYADLLTAQLTAGLAAYVAASSVLDQRYARAGLFAGLAVLLQYPLALVAIAIALVAGSQAADSRVSRITRICLGAAVPALALFFYNTVCFGGPLQLSSRHEASLEYQRISAAGFAGIGLPRIDAFWGLLFSPSRGLFFFAPVLLIALTGLVLLVRARDRRLEALLLALGFGLPLAIFVSYENWHGGSSFGPRYLIPVLPFAAAGLSSIRLPESAGPRATAIGLIGGVALAGFTNTALGLISFPNVPYVEGDPGASAIQSFCLPLLMIGRAPTWLDAWGLPHASLPALLTLIALIAIAAVAAISWAGSPERGHRLRTGGAALLGWLVVVSLQSSIGADETPARLLLRRIYSVNLVLPDGRPTSVLYQ